MVGWFETLAGFDTLLLSVAIVGGVLFLFQLVMMLLGGDSGSDGDVDGGVGLDASDGDIQTGTDVDNGHVDSGNGHVDSDADFKLLSMQSISVFLMIFGLVGLGFSAEGTSATGSLGGAFLAGLLCMFAVAKAFQLFRSLQSSGTIVLKNAVGKQGRVYLQIRKDTPGQIEIELQGHLGIYDARSDTDEEIPTDEQVRVVGVVNSMMIVEQLK